jgi:hypothetical protein
VHPENHYYGHSRLLAEAAFGPGAPAIVDGQIQHGWSLGHGFGARHRQVPWLRRLGWGERTAREATLDRIPQVTLIGAPFTYLAAAHGIDHDTPKPTGTVVYPYHSTEVLSVTGSHERLADEIAEREHGRRVTIVLYFADRTPATERLYAARGFDIVGHGHRSDPEFLHRQLAVLAAHDRIVSNRVGTALWYGAHLGLEAEVYGPWFRDDCLGSFDRRVEEVEHALWPDLFAGPVAGPQAAVLADAELGVAHRRPDEELAELIGGPTPDRRRRARRRAARIEHQARRVLVRGIGTVAPSTGIDYVPMPRDVLDTATAVVPVR